MDLSISIPLKLSEKDIDFIYKNIMDSSKKLKLISTIFLSEETSLNFEVEFNDFKSLNELRDKLQAKFSKISVSFSEKKYLSI